MNENEKYLELEEIIRGMKSRSKRRSYIENYQETNNCEIPVDYCRYLMSLPIPIDYSNRVEPPYSYNKNTNNADVYGNDNEVNLNTTKLSANKSKYSTFNITSGNCNKIRNVVSNSYNKYNTTVKNTIIYNMPDKLIVTGQEGRNALASIYSQTEERQHIFTGFVNAIKYNKKKTVRKRVTLCNIFWNGDVYVADHVNVFENIDDLEVGDFIYFKGELRLYTRNENKCSGQLDDMGIGIVEIYKIMKPNLNINIHEQPPLSDKNYDVSNTPKDILYNFYQKQLTRIRLAVEDDPLYNPNMYTSILQTVYYEGTNDYNMVKKMLNMEIKDMTVRYVKLSCFVRYLVYDCGIHSPYIIYTILSYFSLDKDSDKRMSDIYYMNINRYSIPNFKTFNVDLEKLNTNASIAISNYIASELKRIYDAYNKI